MRIAHLESSLNWGGQELRVIEQAEWLNNNGHACWILARRDSAMIKQAIERGIPHHPIEFRGSANPAIIRELLRFVEEHGIDLIDAHSNRDAAYAMFAKWFSRVTVIRSRHVTTPIKNTWLHRLIWKTGNHGIVTTAKRVNEMIVELGLAKEHQIYAARAGVDANRYHPNIDSTALRAKLGIPPDQKVITNIGMIREDKGQLYFVQACEELAKANENLCFLQIGEATTDSQSYAEKVAAYLEQSPYKSRIRFLGYQPDIENYQALSDIIMICSIGTEAQTRLVSQAFLMRNSVVATRVGGLPEMINHEQTGLLCTPADPKALADACERILNHPEFGERLRDSAEKYAHQEMTFERMMEGMLETYQKAREKLPVGDSVR